MPPRMGPFLKDIDAEEEEGPNDLDESHNNEEDEDDPAGAGPLSEISSIN